MNQFLEDLRQRSQKRASGRSRTSSVLSSFLLIRDDVVQALEAGYAKKTIWEHMHEIGRAPYRYETFLRHVKKHIPNAPHDARQSMKGNAK